MHRWLAILTALALSLGALAQTPAKPAEPPSAPAATRAAILTFGEKDADLVGFFVTADAFRACIPMLKEEKVDTVVVRFRSGGGFYAEVEKFSDLFHHEFKKDFRLVAWVDQAISAAAMSAHSIEEICFTPKGSYGACTGFSGRLDQGTSRHAVQKSLQLGEMISARGKHHPQIMRAMQISSEAEECEPLDLKPPYGALSATVDPASGEVRFFPDAKSGALVLNPKGGVHILTLNADEALKIRFSKGTASTLDELEKVLGLANVEWVGERTGEAPWPICKAERSLMEGRRRFAAAVKDLEPLAKTLNERVSKAQSAAPADRTGLIADARGALDRLKALVAANPALILLNWGGEEEYEWFVERTEKVLAKLEPAAPTPQPAAKPEAPHAPRAAVLTFGDEDKSLVGLHVTAASFRECIPLLKQEKVDIVVIRVHSGGGFGDEVARFSDLFHREYKPDFRLVAWIESATYASALSVHSIEELYFTPEGQYHAGFGGAGCLPIPRKFELYKQMCRELTALGPTLSHRGKHDEKLLRAMQVPADPEACQDMRIPPPTGALSVTVDAGTGEVHFFQDQTSGTMILNPRNGLGYLTLDAATAAAIRFSQGTASTPDELAKAMKLPTVEWAGERDAKTPWLICKAERRLMEVRKQAARDQSAIRRCVMDIDRYVGLLPKTPESQRPRLAAWVRTWRLRFDALLAVSPNYLRLEWLEESDYHEWAEGVERAIKDYPTTDDPDGKQEAK